MNFDDDKPMGYWGRKHIANDPRWTKYYASGSLGPRLSGAEPGFPKLEPAFPAAGGQYFYTPDSVDRFFEELDAWVGGAPARAAARKAEQEAAINAAAAEFEAKAKVQREIRQSGIDAQAQAAAAFAARGEQIKAEINRVASATEYQRGDDEAYRREQRESYQAYVGAKRS